MRASLFIMLLLAAVCAGAQEPAPGTFAFHIPNEPGSLDPAQLTSTDASYLFHNVYRGLYLYRTANGLKPDGAKACTFITPKKLACRLDPRAKWSDGQPIQAEDYVRAFRHLVSPSSKNLGIEMLQNIENANDVFTGKKPASDLGVRAVSSQKLEIAFVEPDPEFLFKLASPLLVPIRSETFPERAAAGTHVYNGPYKIESWQVGKRLKLIANPHYTTGNPARPPVDVYVIDEEETALTLYEKGHLTFLRRLPTSLVAKYKSRPDFRFAPQARFDYVGFGPELKNLPELRRALSLSLDFPELKRVYDSVGMPGCPAIPDDLMKDVPCVRFDLVRAKKALEKVPPETRARRLKFAFSKLGGDDIKKGAEWLQQQWSKNLGLTVDLEQTENTVLLERLRTGPPAIFRKGVGLDRPTCLAALETFAPKGAENFLKLDLPDLNRALRRMGTAKGKEPSRKACSDGVRALIADHWLIPLGQFHFRLLAKTEFSGWDLNELNQLDLSGLRFTPPKGL